MTDRGRKKMLTGVVVSDAMKKSVVIEITRKITHPVYKKIVKTSKKYLAHDESNVCSVGDKVELIECRPISKRKRWRVTQVLEQAKK